MEKKAMRQGLVTIGKILTTQGHRGEVRVLPLTDFPERYQGLEQVYLNWEGRLEKREVSSVRFHKQFVILGFNEVNDMIAAEKLRNALIQVDSDQVYKLPPEHYYIFQLINLPVYTEEEELLGEIWDIFKTGSNDVYQIRDAKSGKEILIPAIKECVKNIDLARGRITVRLLPGLMD